VFNRAKNDWSLFETTRTPEHTEAWLKLAWMAGLQIEAGAFPFKPWQTTFGKTQRAWYCGPKWCGAWDACVGKFLPDDVFEATPIDIRATWT
jgi:hypothetical protein